MSIETSLKQIYLLFAGGTGYQYCEAGFSVAVSTLGAERLMSGAPRYYGLTGKDVFIKCVLHKRSKSKHILDDSKIVRLV